MAGSYMMADVEVQFRAKEGKMGEGKTRVGDRACLVPTSGVIYNFREARAGIV